MQTANKTKAQATTELLFVLSEIILVLTAGAIIYEKLSSISDNNLFLKKFYARDIALVLDEIQALQGNVVYWYKPKTETLSQITFRITPTTIEANDDKHPITIKIEKNAETKNPT